MALEALNSKRAGIGAGAALAAMLAFSNAADAGCMSDEDQQKRIDEITQERELYETERAWAYACQNKVIAIALSGPSKDDPTLQQAARNFQNWFAERDRPTKIFLGETGQDGGYGVSFYVKGLKLGPSQINASALPKMNQATEYFVGAWPDYFYDRTLASHTP